MDGPPDNVTAITDHQRKKKKPWQDTVEQTKGGQLRVDLKTVSTMVESWADNFYYEEFAQKIWVTNEFDFTRGKQKVPREFSELDYLQMTIWVNGQRCKAQTPLVEKAVKNVAHVNARDLLQEYLQGLVWDGKARVDTWLHTYLGADDDHVHRTIGAAWMISAVARAFAHQGCPVKADHILILEGPQGIGKSTALCTLASKDEWFSDQMPDFHNKDASIQLQGVWIQEIAELDAMFRARREATAVKAFLTRTTDRYRAPYAQNAATHVRRCVFAGSTNTTDYLSDETGNRRMWPVPVKKVRIDDLERDRDQLWAEAACRYHASEPWHIQNISVDLELQRRQEARVAHDDWNEPLDRFLGAFPGQPFTTYEFLTHEKGLGFRVDQIKTQDSKRANSMLRMRGFDKIPMWWNGKTQRLWTHPSRQPKV